MEAKEKKFKIVEVRTIQETCAQWDSLISVTEWSNGEGFEIQITSKNGGMQHISITNSEFDLLKKSIKKLYVV